ncbi:MAG TPA: hypothetical protein VNX21_08315 [Candidatus Thermoplasmatota archaeon]|nr:hypothetical protein [Candidatus Thermoplasmatota archaeon]
MTPPVAFRNVVRYVRDTRASAPLYAALGFRPLRVMDGFAVLQNAEGLKLVLHEGEPRGENATALGFTMTGTPEEARAFVETAGWRLVRAPQAEDEGFFFIYGDLDGNPINLVGERRHA